MDGVAAVGSQDIRRSQGVAEVADLRLMESAPSKKWMFNHERAKQKSKQKPEASKSKYI